METFHAQAPYYMYARRTRYVRLSTTPPSPSAIPPLPWATGVPLHTTAALPVTDPAGRGLPLLRISPQVQDRTPPSPGVCWNLVKKPASAGFSFSTSFIKPPSSFYNRQRALSYPQVRYGLSCCQLSIIHTGHEARTCLPVVHHTDVQMPWR